jgi:hypothetical protein
MSDDERVSKTEPSFCYLISVTCHPFHLTLFVRNESQDLIYTGGEEITQGLYGQ